VTSGAVRAGARPYTGVVHRGTVLPWASRIGSLPVHKWQGFTGTHARKGEPVSTPNAEHDHNRTSAADGYRSVRWRLWAAMLALAPTLAGIYLVSSSLSLPEPVMSTARAVEATESAAALMSHEQAIEARLLAVAADPAMTQLAKGIAGSSDKRQAARLLRALRAGDGAVVRSACIVRSSDGKRIPLVTGTDRGGTCANALLQRRAIGAGHDTVTRAPADGDTARLMLATPLRSVSGRNAGVLSAEVDVSALFDRTRMLGGPAVSSMLVDMGSSEVIASALAELGPVDGAAQLELAAVEPHLAGVVAHSDEADAQLADLGLAPTVVPLWTNGNGSHMSLVQLWPVTHQPMPFEVRLALLIMLAGAILAVIVLVRYFLIPFEEMAGSRAELQELYQEAREDALADGLTGLGNHRAFQEELARQVAEFERNGAPFSLVLMDLDDLKVVNDREGHAAGDEMLVSMTQTMRDMARAGDRLYRTGGDEFALLLPGAETEDAVGVAERMLHFSRRPSAGGRPSPFSCGVSGVPAFGRERDMLYRQADAALYWAKRHGRGSVEVFESERDQLPDELSEVTSNAVQEIITGKMLSPVFQPIVDLRTGHVLGFEGLIRPDPSGPLPDTARLFAAAAASGRTVELDLACIEAVVNGARAIGPDRLLTLNLSPRTLEVKDFDPAWLLSGLVRNGISPSRVIIELTEREEVDDLQRLRDNFALLHQYGLRIAADDVGAGNAGLRLLSQVQFDIVKIDLTLVHDGVRRLGSRAVLQSLRDLALSQNARIVAEGVETAEQLQVIRELDIGAGQGFLLGRPIASVEKTFVDVRQLESGVVVPAGAALPAGPVSDDEVETVSSERRAIFLPPAGGSFQAQPGVA
jgi:diguanylate cyclase (GGDEF)-like protein